MLDVLVPGLPHKEYVTKLPPDDLRIPPCKAVITIEPRWVAPRVASQPSLTMCTVGKRATIGHGADPGVNSALSQIAINTK